MKVAAILLIASVCSGSVRVVRQGWSTPGWSTPPPTTAGWTTLPPTTQGWTTLPPTTQGWTTLPPTTQGWSTAPPPTTQGWSTPPPTTQGWAPPPTTPGWAPPAPSGWGSGILSSIDLNAALAAAGSGWAAENHAENVAATGAGGWGGPNAEIVISAGGQSLVDQAGDILQVTSQDGQTAASLNNVAVSQVAEGVEGESVSALGLEISNAQSGWAGAAGEGASAADATTSLTVNQVASSLGMNRP